MGFKDARRDAIAALKEGRVQHEARDSIDEKNLLLTGDVTSEEVVHLLSVCIGTQHEASPHHQDRSTEVHVFKPEASIRSGEPRVRWYIKLYFIEPDAVFISVHK